MVAADVVVEEVAVEDMEAVAADMEVVDMVAAAATMEVVDMEVAVGDMEEAAVDTEVEAAVAIIERPYNASFIACTRYCTLAL